MDWMAREIIERHRNGEMKTGVPNPSLETMCTLVAKAAASITPSVQRRAFRNTGLTLATDGSEDRELSRNLSDLLTRFGQDPTPGPNFSSQFFSQEEIRAHPPSLGKIFRVLCADATKAKEEEFQRVAVFHKMKKDQRYHKTVEKCVENNAKKTFLPSITLILFMVPYEFILPDFNAVLDAGRDTQARITCKQRFMEPTVPPGHFCRAIGVLLPKRGSPKRVSLSEVTRLLRERSAHVATIRPIAWQSTW